MASNPQENHKNYFYVLTKVKVWMSFHLDYAILRILRIHP